MAQLRAGVRDVLEQVEMLRARAGLELLLVPEVGRPQLLNVRARAIARELLLAVARLLALLLVAHDLSQLLYFVLHLYRLAVYLVLIILTH